MEITCAKTHSYIFLVYKFIYIHTVVLDHIK